MDSSEIRIYVADLAAYNAGKLHCVWIDATDDLEDSEQQMQTMRENSPESDAGKYAIHDHEGFAGYTLSECKGLEAAHKVTCFIDEYPDFGGELLNHLSDLEEARRVAEEEYCGCYQSLAEYAQALTEETTDIPENLAFHIDYEEMGRDMQMNGDVFTIETGF